MFGKVNPPGLDIPPNPLPSSMPMPGKLDDVSQALEEGFQVADVRSDPSGVDIELHRDELQLTIHITRDEAREILRGDADAPWLRVG